jgi:hypothetical protein
MALQRIHPEFAEEMLQFVHIIFLFILYNIHFSFFYIQTNESISGSSTPVISRSSTPAPPDHDDEEGSEDDDDRQPPALQRPSDTVIVFNLK